MPKLKPRDELDPTLNERVAVACFGQKVEPTSRNDVGGVAPSHAAPAEDPAVSDEEAGTTGEGDKWAVCCSCNELTIPADAKVITASNGERMLKHEDFVPWFKEDGWRVTACGWSTPASVFVAIGGCSLICTQYLRAICPANSFRLPDNSNKTATTCFAIGVSIFWTCAVYLTKVIPSIFGRTPSSSLFSVGSEKTNDKGPLELIGQRDSGKPQLLSEAAVQELRRVGAVSHIICFGMGGWFVCLGAFSLMPVITGRTTAVFTPGTDFFPPPDCEYGSGIFITILRVLVTATSAPAGVLVSVLFNVLFLSQFLAVAFAKQAVNNLNRKLRPSSDIALARQGSAGSDSPLARQGSAGWDDKEWQKEVHKPFVALVRKTMPQLSAWGPALTAQTIGCLLLGILTIPLTAASDGNPVSGTLISIALVPLINLWGPATVSSRCDEMRDLLNEIRLDEDETKYEPSTSRVFRLIEYSQHYNKGQGIGFVIFGTTINRRVLLAFFGGTVALVSLSAKMISVIAASDEEAQLQMLSEQLIMMQEQQNISETYTP